MNLGHTYVSHQNFNLMHIQASQVSLNHKLLHTNFSPLKTFNLTHIFIELHHIVTLIRIKSILVFFDLLKKLKTFVEPRRCLNDKMNKKINFQTSTILHEHVTL